MTTAGETPPGELAGQPEDATSEAALANHVGTKVTTTEDEFQGYYIVKAILHEIVEMKRVAMRNLTGLGNCRILLDDNQRKPICRLWFSQSQKYLGLLDGQRNEERIAIEDVDDIYEYADRLRATVGYYDGPVSHEPSGQLTADR